PAATRHRHPRAPRPRAGPQRPHPHQRGHGRAGELPLPRQRTRTGEHPRARPRHGRWPPHHPRRPGFACRSDARVATHPGSGRSHRGSRAHHGNHAPAPHLHRRHRTPGHRTGAEGPPLQQDQDRRRARHHLPRAAVQAQEAGDRLKKFLLGLALLTLFAWLLREYFIAVTIVEIPIRGDIRQYVAYAWNLLNNGTFSHVWPGSGTPVPDTFRGPCYPVFLAGLMWLDPEGWYALGL